MQRIAIETGHPYKVHIEQNVLSQVGLMLRKFPGHAYQKAAIITDNIVDSLYGDLVRDSLRNAGFQVCTFIFPNGESSKNIDTVMGAIDFLCKNQITRSDVIIALGGGVVGDLAGFTAATYLRGIDYIQLPTTLLAAVDSSVGGKTAVNVPAGKNLMGCFWQPRLVICDTSVISTLSAETFGDGVAETIKYGCIWDLDLFELLETEPIGDHLEEIIARCVHIKAEVVAQDERDNALRQILNFGHTTGHAIEKLSHLSIPHGQGVAIGMCIAATAGEAAGVTPPGTADRIRRVLQRHQLPTSLPYSVREIAQECLGDKKRSGDTINFIILQTMGKALLHPVKTDDLASFLAPVERS